MATWSELPQTVKDAIVAYYEKKYGVIGIVNVMDAVTQECFENKINAMLDNIKLRTRRQKVDMANAYEPTDSETETAIQTLTDSIGIEE